MNEYGLAALFFAFSSCLVGVLAIMKRNDEVSRTFLVFSLFASSWALANSWMFGNYPDKNMILQVTRLSNLCALFIPPSWLHFVYVYLSTGKSKMRIIKFLYVYSTVLAFFAPSDLFIATVKPIINFNNYPHPGALYHFFTIEFSVAIGYAFYELFRHLKYSPERTTGQSHAFIFATTLAFACGSLTFLPVYDIPFPQYGLFIMPIYPFIMAYAVIRDGFLDSEQVLAIHKEKLLLLGTLSSAINHEIKNPLFLLREYAGKIMENINSNGSREELVQVTGKISAQVSRMSKLVIRLGEFARPNANESRVEEIDLKQVIDDALFFASPELKYQNIEVKIDIPNDLPKLKGDKSQFEVIFLNLIINAYHAMPNGGILNISAKRTDNTIEVLVSDTGIGISETQLKTIFQPFYTTKSNIGTGLGLYVVKMLLQQCGGKIVVDSMVRRGTTFFIYFPLLKDKNSYERIKK